MPDEHKFFIDLADGVRLRVRFGKDRGQITGYVVQLEKWLNEEWCPVIRHDSAHGRPHMDVLDLRGREIDKQWLPGTFNEALTAGVDDLKKNWEQHLARFVEGAE